MPRQRDSESAVSPVIGVILMVAITVVLAGVVFVLVDKTGNKGSDKAPTTQFMTDNRASQIQVIRADSGVSTSALQVSSSVAAHFAYNAAPSLSTTALSAGAWQPLGASGTVQGGDTLRVCSDSATPALTLQVRHVATNQLVYTTTIPSPPVCA